MGAGIGIDLVVGVVAASVGVAVASSSWGTSSVWLLAKR